MKQLIVVIAVVSLLLTCLAGQSLAIGLGGYFEAAGGDGEFEFEYSDEIDVDPSSVAFGFVLDTDLTDRGLFNYRLNVGFEGLDLEDRTGDTLELGGLVVANTFGFAIIKRSNFRWWVGPQIRVGFYSGEWESDDYTDYNLFGLGIGGATGVNFMTGKVCISTSLGVLSNGYAGETDGPFLDREFEIRTSTLFMNVAVLFGL